MVLTRHTNVGEDSSPFQGTRNGTRKATTSRALRKLEIDGNDGLTGRRDKSAAPEATKVYHWRGAVYAVDEDTPQEWIEAQPKRYLKRKREEADSDSSDEETDSESSSEEEPPRKRRVVPGVRSKIVQHNRRTPASTRQARSSPAQPPTPQSIRRGRGRPPKPRPEPAPARRPVGRPRKHPLPVPQPEPVKPKVKPISWPDMMTGRIAVSLTRFLAVQKELRKLSKDYGMARELHGRVLAREGQRKKLDTSLKIGAAVQRTDSRMSRREAIEETRLGASPEARERASSFDTAPSHADLTSPRSLLTASQLVERDDRAENKIIKDRMISKETAEERAKRFNHEWDKVVKWPLKDARI